MNDFIKLLDRPVAFHRCLVDVSGSVEGAVLLSRAIYWQNRMGDEWWYKTAKDWFEETGLSQRHLDLAREGCRKVLLYEVRGMPAKGYYKVDSQALEMALELVCGCKTSLQPGA